MPKLRRRTNSLIADLRASFGPAATDRRLATTGLNAQSANRRPVPLRDRNRQKRARYSPSTLGYLRPQECRHAFPRLVGAGHVVSRAALIGKGMRRIIAVDLMADGSRLQCPFEIVDRRGCAPVVLVGEMALQRHTHLGRLGESLRRDPVKAHP